jgi:hypothetical protein
VSDAPWSTIMQLEDNALRRALETWLRGDQDASAKFANCAPNPPHPHE